MAWDADAQPPKYQTTVTMEVPFMPPMTMIGGQPFVVYELHLTNYAKDSVELRNLTLLRAGDGSVIDQLDSGGLAGHFAVIGQAKQGAGLFLPPGGSGVIFLEIGLPASHSSLSLIHRVVLNILKNAEKIEVITKGATVRAAEEPPMLLGPPLRGGPWAAIYNPSWPTGHRRVFYVIGGVARLPGRYAIDFIKLDSSGKFATGDPDSIKTWLGYNAGVYAVADGIVSSIRTDMSESSTLTGYLPASPENATGNYISIKIGDGRFAFYEHLKPGSIRVKPGQKVKKGELIAALGFTGQTTGPHLHFHVANTDSPLGAEGIPFEFEGFRLLGNYPDLESFGKQRWEHRQEKTQGRVIGERPAPQSVIDFGGR